ncbi:MAG: hypothetical protein ABI844_07205 [Saprospiraceae bacterium]
MTIWTITQNQQTIEFQNTWLGKEKVFLNGKLVTNIFSMFGTTHEFINIEQDQKVTYRLETLVNGSALNSELYINNKQVLKTYTKSSWDTFLGFLFGIVLSYGGQFLGSILGKAAINLGK